MCTIIESLYKQGNNWIYVLADGSILEYEVSDIKEINELDIKETFKNAGYKQQSQED